MANKVKAFAVAGAHLLLRGLTQFTSLCSTFVGADWSEWQEAGLLVICMYPIAHSCN